MSTEILTTTEHALADAQATAAGVEIERLMEAAGRLVAGAVVSRFKPCKTLVLCGPGNNGGDGYVCARHLKASGWPVRVAQLGGRDKVGGGAPEAMAAYWRGPIETLTPLVLDDVELVIDALFGAGLKRPLEGYAKSTLEEVQKRKIPLVAVDVTSGVHGDLARPLDFAPTAQLTVTFFRKKPAHVLEPARRYCGEIICSDIGLPASLLPKIGSSLFENDTALWKAHMPRLRPEAHKHNRGKLGVLSGGATSTGAARLAARAGLRAGAGWVSVFTPPASLAIQAIALEAPVIVPIDSAETLAMAAKDHDAVVAGPGAGVGADTRRLIAGLAAIPAKLVLDADALTSFEAAPDALFPLLDDHDVITPHTGEFARLFPDLAKRDDLNKADKARKAAHRAGCVVVLKGADTVIAAPNARAVINTSAPATLATAGTGDVLAGMIGALLAQGMPAFEAAAAAVWLHGRAAQKFGPGLISEDLPALIPEALRALNL